MKIGFVGLGIMGRPMALNLKAAGHELFVPDRRSLTAELRAAASVLGDAAAVAEQSEVVILMVPDTPDVEAALFGPHGVTEGLKKGTLVIDMSSISPIAFARPSFSSANCFDPNAFTLQSTCAANASCMSMTSMSASESPARSSAIGVA